MCTTLALTHVTPMLGCVMVPIRNDPSIIAARKAVASRLRTLLAEEVSPKATPHQGGNQAGNNLATTIPSQTQDTTISLATRRGSKI
mmetsp:Transcript_35617/g.65930  ORF Transcript_35617/g.65930 Transcript_35617/m.65930 type:complete len:87 (+) Transcript_35617:535-795(+)